MNYSGVSSVGSRTVVPQEWVPILARVRDFGQPAQLAFLRIVSSYSHSAGQHAADLLGLATPLVPFGSAEARIALILRWLGSPGFDAEQKTAMASAVRLMDRSNASTAEDDPNVLPAVRLLLKGAR